eukprot:UN22227
MPQLSWLICLFFKKLRVQKSSCGFDDFFSMVRLVLSFENLELRLLWTRWFYLTENKLLAIAVVIINLTSYCFYTCFAPFKLSDETLF